MKLIFNKTAKYKGKQYGKYVIVIPKQKVEELCWNAGDDLLSKIDDGKLVIERAK